MKFNLLDSNVWVALAMERHAHHREALAWFDETPDDGSVCFCRMTQNSFLRLITSERFFKEDAMSNAAAIRAYHRFRNDPRVGWLDEPLEMEAVWFEAAAARSSSPKLWMDAYLCAFAMRANARVMTFDSGFKHYEKFGLDWMLLG